jgi:ABC-type antimicrobial peptide transport system permease subunit
MWSLQLYGGIGEVTRFPFDDGRERWFRVVGLLSNSVLQGSLLIGQANFKTQFPAISGDQYFLIRTEPGSSEAVAGILENRLGDVGMDVTDSRLVLARMLAVQNTYLRTFQSLGALGLLLGTIGLAIAQLRSVLERRSELAVLRAVGFTQGRVAASVMLEHAGLLIAGIGCGALAALLAVIPYALLGRAELPLVEPLGWMAVIFVVGLLAGLLVVLRVNRLPLLASLRGQ